MSIVTEILILGIFALSLNILVGYTGLVSLGHAAFFGVGAYTAGYISKTFSTNLFLTFAAAILAAILVSAVIGFFCTKLSGFYFLMLTLAFSQMIYSLVHQWTSVTGGTNGLSGISKPTLIAGIDFSNSFALYFLILVIFLLIYFSLKRFLSSPLGKILVGIRENETRMKSMGYNTMFYKNLAFVIAGGLGGAAGCLYTYFNSFVSPSDVYWTMSGSVLIMVLVGGAGTMLGPVLGAAFIVILETIISSYIDLWMLIIGTIFILFVIFAPKGIVGITSGLFSQQSFRKKLNPSLVKIKELKREN
ncbi:branched-chain amino acid ABC transporter permease [Bacillus taeanensis]|uniref:Branched-chain amino acid ABC transporter permease n=2 Tax=Bacillus taeanensis TaxID=273032 RepID=A0A366XXA2_9BACI|nr:branched-chain amino acid ABC transporter permease [Bacillus taeanensis]